MDSEEVEAVREEGGGLVVDMAGGRLRETQKPRHFRHHTLQEHQLTLPLPAQHEKELPFCATPLPAKKMPTAAPSSKIPRAP